MCRLPGMTVQGKDFPQLLQWEPLSANDKFSRPRPPRFEAFMMTGDLILNLSRQQQTPGLLPKHQKKVDSLRAGLAHDPTVRGQFTHHRVNREFFYGYWDTLLIKSD
uniref:Uncharacterized protein n=1 Tax=Timema shepardi TaxID=629360 RepID=A0A7R9BA24_TIMSH|nr:unnamed protein product [Timema shepardi]